MNRSISTILAVIIVALFALFGLASSSSDDSGEAETTAVQQDQAQANGNVSDGNLGDYTVEIKEARITKTFDGKDAIVITYGFTNNSSEAKAFFLSVDAAAFQDGIGLNEALFLKDGDPYTSDNQTKEIKSGASLDVDVAYELNDSTTDVDVEVKEFVSWTDEKITKTFTIK